MKSAIVGAIALCIVSFNASAQETFMMNAGESAYLASATPIFVNVSDQVKGNCLANPAAIKQAVELVFRRSGIEVADTAALPATEFIVTLLGYRVESKAKTSLGCAVHVESELWALRLVTTPYNPDHPVALGVPRQMGAGLLVGSDDQTSYVKETAIQHAELTANAILKARADLKKRFPAQYRNLAKGVGWSQ